MDNIKNNMFSCSKYYTIKNVEDLISGDILLHPIYRDDGLMLISSYTSLTPLLISQIKIHINDNIPFIVVYSEEQLKTFQDRRIYETSDFISDIAEVILKSKDNFKVALPIASYLDERVNLDINDSSKMEPKESYDIRKFITVSPFWNALDEKLESEKLRDRTKLIKEDFLNKICEDDKIIKIFSEMKNFNIKLVQSSINVTCIAMLIGITLELSEKDIIGLCFSALLADCGYIKSDKKLIIDYFDNKEITSDIMQHIKNSIEILNEYKCCIDKDIFYGIMERHEYFSGKGFPLGKKEKDISLFGRILSIATSYENLVGSYFQSSMASNNAINIIWENKEGKFDQQILNVYMYRSNIYKIDRPVFFQGDGKGTVIGFTNYAEAPHKPQVQFINGKIKDFYYE